MSGIRTEGLYKYYGLTKAVDGLDLTVPEGALFGFLGPNGAGKTTVIGMLSTLLRPTAGRAQVAGYDVVAAPAEVRRRIGIVFQEPTLDHELTAAENLRLQADMFGLPRVQARATIPEMLELIGMSDRATTRVGHLSGGQRRRLEIARGLLTAPRVLFLDEPTTGLDTQTRAAVWEYLIRLQRSKGITIFLTTHQLSEAERCDRIAIIDHGTLVTEGSPTQLKTVIGADLVIMRTADDTAAMQTVARRFGLAAEVGADGLRVRVDDGAAMVPALCGELGLPVRSVRVQPPTLDDVFLHHTGRTIRETDAATLTLDNLGEAR